MRLQIIVNCLHLENALFCAEQAVLGGADSLEIGSVLIKNAGLHSVKICKEKFPDIPLIADLKLVQDDTQEIPQVAEAGASGVTVSGAISVAAWERCVKLAHAEKLAVLLDFRDVAAPLIRQQLPLVPAADLVLLSMQADGDLTYILQEIAFRYARPMALSGLQHVHNPNELLALGADTALVEYREGETQNVRAAVQQLRQDFSQIQPSVAPAIAPRDYSEQLLRQKLDQITPAYVAEVYRERPVFLEKVFPLLRFTKIFGHAATIKVWGGGINAVLDFLLEVKPGAIVVVDSSGDAAPVWNGLATVIASKRNLAGAVVYGTVTEIQPIRVKNFPCYATALSALPVWEGNMCQKQIPLQLGNVTVCPDDWLIGDDSGMVCIPSSKIFQVTQQAVQVAQRKNQILREIEATSDWEKVKQLVVAYGKSE
jgi:regulator of RNase E activity RraA